MTVTVKQAANGAASHLARRFDAGYSEERLDSIVTTTVRRAAKGEALYLAGGLAVAPMLILEGVVKVTVTTKAGEVRLADLAGPGDILATAVFEGKNHGETATAASDVKVAVIDLEKTLRRPAGRIAIGHALVGQLKRSRELADDLGLPMGARICRILARLTLRLGKVCDGECDRRSQVAPGSTASWRRLPFSLTHDDVALIAGCARVTATRVLGELKSSGALIGHRGDYALAPALLDDAADAYVYEAI